MVAKTKEGYVQEWAEHIDSLKILGLNPSQALEREVLEAVENIKNLMLKVADLKFPDMK